MRDGLPERKDALEEVRYQPPNHVFVRFCDGKGFQLPVAAVPIDASKIKWETAAVPANGKCMLVVGVKGDEVSIDAGTIRCLVDNDYAAEVRDALSDLMLSREELAVVSQDKPPPEWLFEPSPDLRRESWK
jgi:hypothetical protein